MLEMSIISEHELCTTLKIPITNDVKSVISAKPSSIKFRVIPVRFGGKHSSHSEENDHENDNDDGDDGNEYDHEHEQLVSCLHHNQKLKDANVDSLNHDDSNDTSDNNAV